MGTLNERTRGLALPAELRRYAFPGDGLLTLGASTARFCAQPAGACGTGPATQLRAGQLRGRHLPAGAGAGMTLSVYHSFPESRGTVRVRSPDPAESPAIRPAT